MYLKRSSKTVANFPPTDKAVKRKCFGVSSVNTFRLLDFSLSHDDPSRRYMLHIKNTLIRSEVSGKQHLLIIKYNNEENGKMIKEIYKGEKGTL